MGLVKKSPVMGVTKKSPVKGDRTPAKRTRALSAKQDSPFSASKMQTPPSAGAGTPRTFTSRIPTKEELSNNGRVHGRSLIKWNRPRMAEKLILHLYYESVRHKVLLPWDAVAHRFHPGSSGGAILQHLNRMRKELISEGHVVPPVPFKTGTQQDQGVRGYIRENMEGPDKETVRPVYWGEVIPDPKYNLPDAFNDDDDDEPFNDAIGQPSFVGKSPGSPSPYPKHGHGMPNGLMRAKGAQLDDPFAPGLDGTQEFDAGMSFSSQPGAGSGKMCNTPPQQAQSFGGFVNTWGNMYDAELDTSVVQGYRAPGGPSQLDTIDQGNYGSYSQNPYAVMQDTMMQPTPGHASPEEESKLPSTPPQAIDSLANDCAISPFTLPGQIGSTDYDDSIESALIFHLAGAYGSGIQQAMEV